MKKIALISAVLASLMAVPLVASADPSFGIGYSNIDLSGHSSRPGVSVNMGDLLGGGYVANGFATVARSFYQIDASVGKLIAADNNALAFEPFVSANFLHAKENTPVPQTISDSFLLAGVNTDIPVSRNVSFGFGGAFGHTLSSTSGTAGGQVYTGDAMANLQLTRHVTTDVSVTYLHVPGQNTMEYDMGLNYLF